jgi:hypothetical protein
MYVCILFALIIKITNLSLTIRGILSILEVMECLWILDDGYFCDIRKEFRSLNYKVSISYFIN